VWAGLSTPVGDGNSDSPTTPINPESRRAALMVFQTCHDLYYRRSSDEAADLAAFMLMFENGIAFNVTQSMTWHTMGEKSKAAPKR